MKMFDTGHAVRGAAVVALALAAQIQGLAGSLGVGYDPVYSSTVYGTGQNVHETSAGTNSNADGYVTLGAFPSPYLDVEGTAPYPNGFGGGGSITYYFEYSGAAGPIPVDISYFVSFSGNPQYSNESSEIQVFDAGQNLVNYACVGSGAICYTDHTQGSQSGVFQDTLNANQVYEISLSTYMQFTAGGAGIARDFVGGPVISLDPSFTGDSNSYSLLFTTVRLSFCNFPLSRVWSVR